MFSTYVHRCINFDVRCSTKYPIALQLYIPPEARSTVLLSYRTHMYDLNYL
jgi:hypothetical protein